MVGATTTDAQSINGLKNYLRQFRGEKTFVRVDVVGDTSKCVTIFEAKGKFNKTLDTIWPFLVPGHICGYFYEAKIDK